MAAPAAGALAKHLLSRRAAIGALNAGRGNRGGAVGKILAAFVAVVVLLAAVVSVILGASQATCGTSAEEIPGAYSGPGSLGGVMGTGVTAAELQRARRHPLGGTALTAGPYRSTAYAPSAGGINCDVGGSCESTASGIRVNNGRRRAYVIASNPRLNKYGALAYIWPNPYGWRGPFVVADTGGDFQGSGRLDFYIFEDAATSQTAIGQALAWGNARMVTVSSKPVVDGGPAPADAGPPSTANMGAAAVPPGGSTTMLRPTSGPQTSPFGMRWGRLHAGIDIAPPLGTPIVAVLDGVVVLKGFVSGYGNFTCIRHRPDLSTCYGHQAQFADIRQGAPVRRGQVIGYVGSTGQSTGPHLHFEVRRGPGFSGTPVDPAPFLAGSQPVDAPTETVEPGAGQCPAPAGGEQAAAGNTPVSSGYYAWPAGTAFGQGRGRIIGRPGEGTHSFSAPPNNWQSDNAIDIALPVGTPILAVDDGVISTQLGYGLMAAGTSSRFAGMRLHLEDSRGNTWYLAHLSKLVVRPGERVRRGQIIGYSGSANGVAHLHLASERSNPQILLGAF